jgi:DNA-binding response OmpR family regulator
MSVVLLTSDLTVVSRVEGAARMWGFEVHSYSSASQALANCSWQHARLLIVDLATFPEDMKRLLEALDQITDPRPRVLAFGPHVHEEKLAAAREAGCDQVVSRGQFFAKLIAILRDAAGEPPSNP